MYKKANLNNGVTLVTNSMSDRVSVSLGIWIKVGARYEKEQISGISHFLEHLLFKGTEKRSCEEIKQSIEGIGGSLNGFTTEEFTCYLTKVPAKHLDSALDVLWDMVSNARLDSGDIQTERRVILEEIKMYRDLPGHYVSDLLTKLLWPKQPLGMNIAGEIKSIKAITRNHLLAFKQKFYQPTNIVVVACGNLRHSRVRETCRKLISLSRKGKINKFSPAKRVKKSPQTKFYIKDIEQTHLALGVYGLPRAHPQRFFLGLLNVILGANMSSRLFREVREIRGLAYEIGTSLKFFQDTGAFTVYAGIDNRRVIDALEVILEQLRAIKRDRIDEDELKRAKEYYIGQLMLAFEDTSNYMIWLGENFVSLNKFLYLKEIIRCIEKIDSDDLIALANKILQNNSLKLALIGPLKDEDGDRIKKRLIL